jgi:hypothetical protein
MHKFALSLVAAAALTGVSTAANAAIIVNGSTNVDPSTVLANNTNDPTQNTLIWGQDLTAAGGFTGSVDFSNNLSGLYSVIVSSSTPGAVISSVTLAGILGTPGSYSSSGASNSLSLFVPFAGSGNYRVSFGGTAPENGAAVTGNLTFRLVPVPEPATWAMMLLGFWSIGIAIRRNPKRGAALFPAA